MKAAPKPNKLRAHVVRYATNQAGGEFWTWWLTNGNGSLLCKGPLGFRTWEEARTHAKQAVAAIATGKLTRRIERHADHPSLNVSVLDVQFA